MSWSAEKQREMRKLNPERYREYERRRAKKNLPAFREKCRRAQFKFHGYPEPTRPRPERCECCDRIPPPTKGLALDHDHVTGAFRGWLCHNCNLGIGRLGDSVEALERALAYLKNNNKQVPHGHSESLEFHPIQHPR